MFPYQQLSQATRDSILAMVLSTCEASIYPRVVACFPSAELLTNLLHSFVSFHLRQEISWIHPATLKINEESPEFIGSLICSGAALSRVLELRKLGFAMQEALRLFMPTMVCCSAWCFFRLTLNFSYPSSRTTTEIRADSGRYKHMPCTWMSGFGVVIDGRWRLPKVLRCHC